MIFVSRGAAKPNVSPLSSFSQFVFIFEFSLAYFEFELVPFGHLPMLRSIMISGVHFDMSTDSLLIVFSCAMLNANFQFS